MNTNQEHFIEKLKVVLGARGVRVGKRETEHYRMGWRSGGGDALAVVFPKTLVQMWQVLTLCVEADCIIIMQAANTGLTEGSTPSANGYDRDIVIINTLAINSIVTLGQGEQVICFAGSTLHQLESTLSPLNRAPHSVIGSSCLGASVIGGVANNSGGALVKRGPAYTEMALFAQVDEKGKLNLVNHLGIDLGNTPEQILTHLQQEKFDRSDAQTMASGSARDYTQIIRQVNADTPSRYNADTSKLFEASGCAGKVAVFAVRLDTFEIPVNEQTFYIGTNSSGTLTEIRRHMLAHFSQLPEVAEYLHRDAFKVAQKYGKDTFLAVKKLGTKRLPTFFSMKGRIDATLNKIGFLPRSLTDKLMQLSSKLYPQHLPHRLLEFADKYEHHLVLKMSDTGIQEAKAYFDEYFAHSEKGGFFSCSAEETQSAFLHRFAVAGAAIRYQSIHSKSVGDMLALDIALKRNEMNWVEQLPESVSRYIHKSLYYGHFFCHVFHQDYILTPDADTKAIKKAMLALLDKRGAKYPAEHNVGHLYEAEDGLRDFYKQLDPTNTFNPGVGNMDKHKRRCACC